MFKVLITFLTVLCVTQIEANNSSIDWTFYNNTIQRQNAHIHQLQYTVSVQKQTLDELKQMLNNINWNITWLKFDTQATIKKLNETLKIRVSSALRDGISLKDCEVTANTTIIKLQHNTDRLTTDYVERASSSMIALKEKVRVLSMKVNAASVMINGTVEGCRKENCLPSQINSLEICINDSVDVIRSYVDKLESNIALCVQEKQLHIRSLDQEMKQIAFHVTDSFENILCSFSLCLS